MITRFQNGRTYACRSICDHECIYRFDVIGRTEKTVTIRSIFGDKRRKVRVDPYENCEVIDPLGRYSMSPVLRATKLEN